MTAFDRAVRFVLEHEGGMVDDPLDPGGLTQFGISQRSYPSVNIRALTAADAMGIYRRDYWDKLKLDHFPPALAILTFDCAVNQGPGAAARILQLTLGVKADGVIGPATIAAANQIGSAEKLVELAARRMHQYGQVPQFMRYGLGWSRRLMQCFQLAMEAL